MLEEHTPEVTQKASASAMILQIDRPGEETPLQFPAVIRNLAAGIATLEVNNPWTILNWDTLKGQGGCLRLLAEDGNVTDLKGKVTWTKYTIQGYNNGNLSLTLALTNPDPAAQKLLCDFIPHTSQDIKEFWERWDQTQAGKTSKRSIVPSGMAISALALLLTGLALQMTGTEALKLFGWVLWLGGTMLVGLQALRFWKSRKAS